MKTRLKNQISKYSKTADNTIICYEFNNDYPACITFTFNGQVKKLLKEIPLFINKLINDIIINCPENDRAKIDYLLRKEIIKSI